MPQGQSTRAVGAPIGTAGRFSPTGGIIRVVPLSAFFLDAEDQEIEAGALTGFKRKKRSQGKGSDSAQERPQTKNKNASPDSTQVAGGDASAADTAVQGKRQSTAASGKQESATMSTGTPLIAPGGATRHASFPGGASKLGATRASAGGAMGTGNVAQAPVPIGPPLRRRRREKKKQESLGERVARLGRLAL